MLHPRLLPVAEVSLSCVLAVADHTLHCSFPSPQAATLSDVLERSAGNPSNELAPTTILKNLTSPWEPPVSVDVHQARSAWQSEGMLASSVFQLNISFELLIEEFGNRPGGGPRSYSARRDAREGGNDQHEPLVITERLHRLLYP